MLKGSGSLRKHLIALVIGLLFTLLFCAARGSFSGVDTKQAYLLICDGCFATSVLFLGVGLMLLVSNMGTFDILNYGMRTLFGQLFRKEEKKKPYGTFYEYRMMRASKKAPFGFLVAVGTVFLIAAFIFNLLYESIPV